ncbi:serine/threonine-protein phosphatase with EF-hands 2-like isoform X2 [Bolinopsis microptera]|uniref:serine/threonine-protein phosphatase with EF-hands 2-like isoform X2 n=1 Tax=Bolinopsis microptera TaxID=2820187 RepID=UPI003078B2CD
MGCASSNTSNDKEALKKLNDLAEINSAETQLRATLMIQRWFRRWRAELEVRRRCTWTIFQTMEYASENEQLKLYNFFNDIISGLPDAFNAMQNEKNDQAETSEYFSKLSNPDYVTIDPDYKGPDLVFPIDENQIKIFIEAFKERQVLDAKHLLILLAEARKHFMKIENVQYTVTSIAGKVTVVGDLHGSLDDLLMIFFKNGLPSADNPYVINGDFVDRGPASVEVSILLFILCLLYPNSFLLNRGNHEDVIMNKRYGFTTELVKKYGLLANRISKGFEGVFRVLPLVTVVDNSVLICHGGVSDITDLNYINDIPRHKYASILRPPTKINDDGEDEIDLIEWRQMLDLLWSDPKAAVGCEPNTFRGGGTYFGPDISKDILDKHNFKLLIRSHECKPDGYDVTHDGLVVTIFSASNYYEAGSNLGAYIKLGPSHKPQFIQFSATENTKQLPLYSRVSKVESSALRDLRTQIFSNKGRLLDAFESHDTEKTGLITMMEWTESMSSVLNLDLPWRTLRSKLVEVDDEGKIKYDSCFTDGTIEGSIANKQVTETIYRQRNILETIFRLLDTDNSGLLSREELRAGCELLAKHNGSISLSPDDLDNLVDTMDINKDGEINFNEFLESFRMVDNKFSNGNI